VARLALTAEQQAVVTAPDGPLLVLAGPGAGKTAVLTARIAQLITDRGVGPASVLALTFSNRAAQELRARLAERLGDKGNVVDVATFHDFGLRVLRQWRTRLGFPANRLTVYDAQAARAVFTDVVRACGVPAGGLPLRVLWHVVEHYRMTGSGGAHAATLQALTAAYEAELRRRSAVDFPAMLREPLRLLQGHPDVARLYRVAYRAILVDEAQDTVRHVGAYPIPS
jgi:DNA helicase-2/ATP-dependent DNA helicase PcrA